MKIQISSHAFDRLDKRITNIAPELKDVDRLMKLIKRSGKWFINDDGAYFCLINNLIVCIFQLEGEILVLVTIYPYTQSFKGGKMQHLHKIDDLQLEW